MHSKEQEPDYLPFLVIQVITKSRSVNEFDGKNSTTFVRKFYSKPVSFFAIQSPFFLKHEIRLYGSEIFKYFQSMLTNCDGNNRNARIVISSRRRWDAPHHVCARHDLLLAERVDEGRFAGPARSTKHDGELDSLFLGLLKSQLRAGGVRTRIM